MLEDTLRVNANEYLPLRDVVFITLRKAILQGELKPGERLMETQLADRLGVSRTPIREAIRKLELEGLVVMIPRKGAEVAGISEEDLRDVLEVRKALEVLATQLACDRITQEQIDQLKEQATVFKTCTEKGDLTALAEADVRFHDVLYQAANNKRLLQISNNLREQMYRYRMEYLKDKNKHNQLVTEHDLIILSVEKREKRQAVDIISKHIENQEWSVSDKIKKSQQDDNA